MPTTRKLASGVPPSAVTLETRLWPMPLRLELSDPHSDQVANFRYTMIDIYRRKRRSQKMITSSTSEIPEIGPV